MPAPSSTRPGSRSLYRDLRARIGDGSYAAGTPLPSTRVLAAERGLSRGTVSLVYEQLASDGFVDTRPGAATRVAAGAADRIRTQGRADDATEPHRQMPDSDRLSAFAQRLQAMPLRPSAPDPAGVIDFVYGPLAGSDFPTLQWIKALRRAEGQRSQRLEYATPLGAPELRQALQKHLHQTRDIRCSTEQILVVNGSQHALDLCARLLLNPSDRVVVENPGYRMAHQVFAAYGAQLVCADVDDDGLQTAQLAALTAQAPAKLAYATPGHQFPLGGFLPIARRHALLDWARAQRCWLIEDDYDSDYRYTVRPEPSLWSLDRADCVIHVGTFSKTLSPQLRLGYMVLPPALAGLFAQAKLLTDRHSATGPQRALAQLIDDGSYARHVRRMRRKQQARQQALLQALERHLGTQVRIQGAASGLHLAVWFPALPASCEAQLVQAAAQRGVRVYPISPLYLQSSSAQATHAVAGVVMGYALLDLPEIARGVQRLAEALQSLR
ncbi:MocR-like pyridoxine biosynthesis transcription factor PdxR [Comamonas squillarum]|uniref:PLP-dependent aminotransferase family protein n=1 Tax=Comamonas squillarum TaxID=2977320 RepID=A0ABY6A633_9BURK|nr:PLP-dependent aminotransferase family protein [Comamonas sp. PR12]UXC20657.1 PLP-dependent aminotransferase family protein [Comamonas sp. PR12]